MPVPSGEPGRATGCGCWVVVEFQSESVGPANISLPAFPSDVFLSADFTPNYHSLTVTLSASNEEIWGGLRVVNRKDGHQGWGEDSRIFCHFALILILGVGAE